MRCTLRGAWSRRATLLPLLLLITVVVAGTVTVVGLAGRAGVSALLAAPLLLIGAVAVPAAGRELAAERRPEIALARVRGLSGGELYLRMAVEPLIVLVLGAGAGLLLGMTGSSIAGRILLDDPTGLPGVSALVAGAGIVLAGLVGVLLGMAGALREPLADQVSIASRPRHAQLGAVFATVLVFVGAAVAVYRSGSTGSDPDLVVLAGPALVGLVAGQVAVWLILAGARIAVARTTQASPAGFLAARRLARVSGATHAVRLVVAAAVVAALALTGATQIDDWTEDTARLRAGGPVQVVVEADALEALALTRELDPEGRWLMAAVLVPGEGSASARRAFVDTERYDAVVGDFFAGTAAAGVSGQIDALGAGRVEMATGDRVSVTVQGVSARQSGAMRPRVVVRYLDQTGAPRTARVSARLDLDGTAATAATRVVGCSGGCTLTAVTLARSPGDTSLPWVLSALEFAGVDALSGDWRPVEPDSFGQPGGPLAVDGGLLARSSLRPLTALPEAGGAEVPVLATDSVDWAGNEPQLDSTGGDERSAQVVERLPALPLVEADGLLADLQRSAMGAPPTVPAASVLVLARTDTPADLLVDLVERAGHEASTLAQADRATEAETGAAQAGIYALTAFFCLVVALLALIAATARQRSSWRHEVAALRVIGLPIAWLRRSGRIEVLWLAVAAVLVSSLGAVVAVRLLLADLPLVAVPVHSVPLRIGVQTGPVVLAAVAAAVVVAVAYGRSRRTVPDRTRPEILREESR